MSTSSEEENLQRQQEEIEALNAIYDENITLLVAIYDVNITLLAAIYDDNITGEDDGGVEILTRIVTVFSKTVKNRLMSAGLNVTMRHLWPHLNIPKVSDMLTMQITDHFTMLISSPNTLLSTQTFRLKPKQFAV